VNGLKVSKELKKLTTTQTEMARALGISQQRVSQMLKEDIMVRDKSGSVLVIESLKNYYKLRSSELGDGEEIDLNVEKAKHEKTKREIAELKLAMMEGKAYDARTVELVLTEMLSNLRTQLLGMPSKLAPQLERKKKEKIYELMTKEIEEKLNELSEYTPNMFTQEEIKADDDEDSD
jgi:predicted transcriptional regulator